MLSADELFFFNEHPAAVALYEAFVNRLLGEIDDVTVKVQKTQISFANKRNFTFVSFLPVRKAKERPGTYITVTLVCSTRRSHLALMWPPSLTPTAGHIMC